MSIFNNDRMRYLEERLNELDGLRGKVIDYISAEMAKLAGDIEKERSKMKPQVVKLARFAGRQETYRLMRDRILDIYFED